MTSQLETVKKSIRQMGFPKKWVKDWLRGSSLNFSKGTWRIFPKWCAKYKTRPWQSSIQLIAEFLLYWLDEGKLKSGQKKATET